MTFWEDLGNSKVGFEGAGRGKTWSGRQDSTAGFHQTRHPGAPRGPGVMGFDTMSPIIFKNTRLEVRGRGGQEKNGEGAPQQDSVMCRSVCYVVRCQWVPGEFLTPRVIPTTLLEKGTLKEDISNKHDIFSIKEARVCAKW